MENDNKEISQTGSYQIESIILMNNTFHREIDIDFAKEIRNNISIVSESSIHEDNQFSVTVKLSLNGVYDNLEVDNTNQSLYNFDVSMVGVFSKKGEPLLSEDNFKKINAPAIIYPFLREFVTSLSQKASIGTVILPPVNFTIS